MALEKMTRAEFDREKYWHERNCGEHAREVSAEDAPVDADDDARVPAADVLRTKFVSHEQIGGLTDVELRQAVCNALTVHPRDCRQVLVREILGRLEGKIPRD